MMISDLPTDLVEEILSRVPTIFLKRIQSTCKRWSCIFKDRGFAEKHFRQARKQSLVLMLKKNRICLVSVNLNVVPPSIEFTDTVSLRGTTHSKSEQVGLLAVCHCDGLLLFTTEDKRLVVWNPCLGEETTSIQLEPDYSARTRFFLGYQKNKACHSYKILRWNYGVTGVRIFEIYEFCSNLWRVLNDVNPKCSVKFVDVGEGVTLKGNTYWIAKDDKTDNQLLLCFDFTTERFKHLCLPKVSDILTVSVVGEEQLLLIHQDIQDPDSVSLKTEMYVTKKIDSEAAVSWSKCFKVDILTLSYFPLVDSSLLIDEEKKVALCSIFNDDGKENIAVIGEDDKYYKEIVYVDYLKIFHYVPSLVHWRGR